jgi:raffinose/stachyose/melibiose transport system substrate-binding protein
MSFRYMHTSARRGVVLAASALAVSALALAGCSSGGSGSGSGSAASGGSATTATVNWWGWTPDIDVAQREIAQFNKAYPHITVVFKKLQDASYNAGLRPALASGAGPDVFDTAVGGLTGAIGTFGTDAIDLAPAMQQLRGSSWKNGLYSPGITDFTVNGQLKSAQLGRVASGFLWINQDLFTKYNLQPPTTLAQWVSVCQTFRSHGLPCFEEGVGQPGFDTDTLHTIVNSVQPGAWAQAAKGQIKWTSPAIVQGLGIFKELSTDGILAPGADGIQQYPDVNNAFLSGKVPMVQMGTWYQQYTEKASIESAIQAAGVSGGTQAPTIVPIAFPNVGGHTPELFGDPDYGLAVNAQSKVKSAATTFALWLTSTQGGQQIVADNLDEYPVLLSVAPQWASLPLVDGSVQTPDLKNLSTLVNQVTEPRQANLSGAMVNALIAADQAVIGGQQTPAQAAASIQAAQDANPVSNS